MPPQGGGDFSDYEIARAVVYMADKGGAKFPEPAAPQAAASGAATQVLSGGLGTGGFTSVWTPERINRRWRRCPACAAMVDAERSDPACACAAGRPS